MHPWRFFSPRAFLSSAGVGCGGGSGTHLASPLSFLLPALPHCAPQRPAVSSCQLHCTSFGTALSRHVSVGGVRATPRALCPARLCAQEALWRGLSSQHQGGRREEGFCLLHPRPRPRGLSPQRIPSLLSSPSGQRNHSREKPSACGQGGRILRPASKPGKKTCVSELERVCHRRGKGICGVNV